MLDAAVAVKFGIAYMFNSPVHPEAEFVLCLDPVKK